MATYCSALSDRQVKEVYLLEVNRMKGLGEESEVFQAAKDLAQEAKEELLRRGLPVPEIPMEEDGEEEDTIRF